MSLLLPKSRIIRSGSHRRFISKLPCCISGIERQTQAAHIRSGWLGMGIKPSDELCIPLSWKLHAKQHQQSEKKFWEPYGGVERAKELAKELYKVSGDMNQALVIVSIWRNHV